jgi:hypothetical protein
MATLYTQHPHPLLVIPERQWNMEDFRAQCAGDPYVKEANGQEHGTVGAVVLDGTVTYEDGSFHFATVTGRSQADYSVEVLSCADQINMDGNQTSGLESVISDKVSKSSWRAVPSIFPLALGLAMVSANVTAKTAFLPAPVVNGPNNTVQAYSNSVIATAVGSFAAASAGLVFGNPNSALSLRKTFEEVADEVNTTYTSACRIHDYAVLPICYKFMNVMPVADLAPVPKGP